MKKLNYYDMANNCNHLTVTQKSVLTNPFKKYKDLFSGNLGKVPRPPIVLKLKIYKTILYYCIYYSTSVYKISKTRNRRTRRYICIYPRYRYCIKVSIFFPRKEGWWYTSCFRC